MPPDVPTPDSPRTPGPRAQAAAAAALVAATFAAYLPSIRGTMLWDDQGHVTSPRLQSLAGLRSIWLRLGSTQQYYPLLHSAFWVEHRIWGGSTLAYHLLNVSLHALCACLFAAVLARIFRGRIATGPWVPWFAAALFALHPVCVESVAWISEQKNTLSLVLYLLSALAYLRFDSGRGRAWYGTALVLYAMAVLCKSVTATLPAAILLVLWWRRRSLSLRRDVLPLVPWFLFGVPAGLLTAWVERTYIGAHGSAFSLGIAERVALAGTVVWFYLGKLAWPAELAFIYPHWEVRASLPWLAGPLLLCAALAGLWLLRRRAAGPLVVLLFFVGSLFPVLGFFNVYPFRFSYVADHWQYLPSLGVFALAAVGLDLGARRLFSGIPARAAGAARAASGAALLGVLFLLTWGQSGLYRDELTLYTDTLAKNPGCWMAHGNLGVCLLDLGSTGTAIAHLREAVRLKPDYSDGHNNLGNALLRLRWGREEAIREYETAVRLEPGMWQAHGNLGSALVDTPGRLSDGVAELAAALREAPEGPESADLHAKLGAALSRVQGRMPEAIGEFRAALEAGPAGAGVRCRYAMVLDRAGRPAEALAELRRAASEDPSSSEAQKDLGNLLSQEGRPDEALAHYREAVRLDPRSADAHFFLGRLLAARGDAGAAEGEYRLATALAPDSAPLWSSLGSLLYGKARYAEALAAYREAAALDPGSAAFQSNLALALVKLGRYDEAIAGFRGAMRIDPSFSPARIGLAAALRLAGREPGPAETPGP